MDMAETIRNFIREVVNSSNVTFRDNESLYDIGVLDSLKIIQLVVFLQSEFGISIDPSDMLIEDFESVDSIVAYIKKCKKDG